MAEIDQSLIGVWGPASTMKIELGKIREFAKAVKRSRIPSIATRRRASRRRRS